MRRHLPADDSAPPESFAMKVLIDAHMLGAGETGNETYIRGLLRGLLEVGAPQAVAVTSRGAALLESGHDIHILAGRSDIERLLIELPRLALDTGADLVHCTYVAPPRCPVPAVVTVHDVSFARHPEWFTLRDRAVLRAAVPYSARHAQAVMVPSEHARSEVVELVRVRRDIVYVTPEACGPEFHPLPPAATAETLRRCGISGPYVLSLGNLQPRKNLARLLDAWRRLHDAGRLEGHRLVLAGGTHGRRAPVERQIADLGLAAHVVLPGFVSAKDLPALYVGATAFVYPSLYEGFGLPLLEAMACGTAVASSNAASLPDVAGDAALLFNPLDPDAIAAALGTLLTSADLREALAIRGRARARTYSWAACARATLAAYERASEPPHSAARHQPVSRCQDRPLPGPDARGPRLSFLQRRARMGSPRPD